MYQSQNFAAGVPLEFQDAADFLRILEAPTDDLTLIFYRGGAEVARAENVGAGYAEKFSQQFDKLRISSAAGGVIEFVTRLGAQVNYDKPPTGTISGTVELGAASLAALETVNIVDVPSAFTQAQKTVTNASTQMLAANAARAYLLIQNNDTSGIIYVNLTGAAATTSNGVKLGPGASLEIAGKCPNAAITAIGSLATQSNVIAVEG